MRRKKALLKLALWMYSIFSSVCLIGYLVPAIGEPQAFRVWLLGTDIFRLGLAACMCVLLVRMIRLWKISRQLKKWR